MRKREEADWIVRERRQASGAKRETEALVT